MTKRAYETVVRYGRFDGCQCENIRDTFAYRGPGARLLGCASSHVGRLRVQERPAAQKLGFPAMLVDDEGCVAIPLGETIARAQEGIDEALETLTPEQRGRYRAGRWLAILPLYPSGTLSMVTLEGGRLRVWDDAPLEEALARLIEDEEGDDFSRDCPCRRPSMHLLICCRGRIPFGSSGPYCRSRLRTGRATCEIS